MDGILQDLLNELERIGQENEELYDTECRDMLSSVIFDGFLRPREEYIIPLDLGLYTQSANLTVGQILFDFIQRANQKADELGLTTFHGRLAAFQNTEIRSQQERCSYDDFFGYAPPELYDANGRALPT